MVTTAQQKRLVLLTDRLARLHSVGYVENYLFATEVSGVEKFMKEELRKSFPNNISTVWRLMYDNSIYWENASQEMFGHVKDDADALLNIARGRNRAKRDALEVNYYDDFSKHNKTLFEQLAKCADEWGVLQKLLKDFKAVCTDLEDAKPFLELEFINYKMGLIPEHSLYFTRAQQLMTRLCPPIWHAELPGGEVHRILTDDLRLTRYLMMNLDLEEALHTAAETALAWRAVAADLNGEYFANLNGALARLKDQIARAGKSSLPGGGPNTRVPFLDKWIEKTLEQAKRFCSQARVGERAAAVAPVGFSSDAAAGASWPAEKKQRTDKHIEQVSQALTLLAQNSKIWGGGGFYRKSSGVCLRIDAQVALWISIKERFGGSAVHREWTRQSLGVSKPANSEARTFNDWFQNEYLAGHERKEYKLTEDQWKELCKLKTAECTLLDPPRLWLGNQLAGLVKTEKSGGSADHKLDLFVADGFCLAWYDKTQEAAVVMATPTACAVQKGELVGVSEEPPPKPLRNLDVQCYLNTAVQCLCPVLAGKMSNFAGACGNCAGCRLEALCNGLVPYGSGFVRETQSLDSSLQGILRDIHGLNSANERGSGGRMADVTEAVAKINSEIYAPASTKTSCKAFLEKWESSLEYREVERRVCYAGKHVTVYEHVSWLHQGIVLDLPIEAEQKKKTKNERKKLEFLEMHLTLQQIIDAYLQEKHDENYALCNTCNAGANPRVGVRKGCTYTRSLVAKDSTGAAPWLVLAIQRTYIGAKSFKAEKLKTPLVFTPTVQIPFADLSSITQNPGEGRRYTYLLEAVACHNGASKTPDSGHYYAYRRGADDKGGWWRLDDAAQPKRLGWAEVQEDTAFSGRLVVLRLIDEKPRPALGLRQGIFRLAERSWQKVGRSELVYVTGKANYKKSGKSMLYIANIILAICEGIIPPAEAAKKEVLLGYSQEETLNDNFNSAAVEKLLAKQLLAHYGVALLP